MLITVIKKLNGVTAVTAEQKVEGLDDLILFATKLGVNQSMEDYLEDFEQGGDRTYILGLENEF